MGKKGGKYPAHQIARKKIIDDQKSPPPPSRVKLSAPKSSIKPLTGLIYFKPMWEGGGLIETEGLFERAGLFNLEKMMVSVLRKELEYEVEKLKCKKF